MSRISYTKIVSFVLELLFPRREVVRYVERIFSGGTEQIAAYIPYCVTHKYTDVWSIWNYKGTLAETIVREIKYRGNTDIARAIAPCVRAYIVGVARGAAVQHRADVSALHVEDGEEVKEELTPRTRPLLTPILIPMPISTERRAERGYNQCEIILQAVERVAVEVHAEPEADAGVEAAAAVVADADASPQPPHFEYSYDVLAKTRHTETQTDRGRAGRLANLQGCFAVASPQRVQGRICIIIDDVVTTGATLSEAMLALRAAGALRVLAVTLAH